MAEFWTISQKGFTFTKHTADKLVKDEEWSIERVAAFMAVHYVLTVMATKYSKGLTVRPRVAMIQYTLECDPATSKDIDNLTKLLVSDLSDKYSGANTQGYLGRPLDLVLDDVEALAREFVRDQETPMEVFGKTVTPPPFYTRPSKAEYDALLEKEQSQTQKYWDAFKKVLDSGAVKGHHILVREGVDVYTAYLLEVTAKCVYVDLKDEYGRLLQSHARLPRNSPRFIIESFE